MLHRSETWPVRKENEVALQRAEMRVVRWMCNVKVNDRVPSKELRERLGIDDIILILQQNRLQCRVSDTPGNLLEIYKESWKFSGLVGEFARLSLILVTILVFQSVSVQNVSW